MPKNELSGLPRDVIFDILSRVPTKSLLQFRCVSKSCPPLISHPHFIKLHLSCSISGAASDHRRLLLYYESPDYTVSSYSIRRASEFSDAKKLEIPFKSLNGYLRIVGSCNGIVCIFDTNYFTTVGAVVLWNPSIGKLKIVPNSHRLHRFRHTFSHMIVGFGFVAGARDFKIVQILYDLDNQAVPEILIYSLDENRWRKIDAIAPCFVPRCWSNNVFVKMSVHWISYRRPKLDGGFNSIMAFDLCNESFRSIEFPTNHGVDYDQIFLSSSIHDESLSMFFHFRDGLGDCWDIWFMKDYGVEDSWTKQFSIAQLPLWQPLRFMDGGELMLVLSNGKLVLYDPNSQTIKDTDIHGLPCSFRVVGYMSSLALLDGGDKFAN